MLGGTPDIDGAGYLYTILVRKFEEKELFART